MMIEKHRELAPTPPHLKGIKVDRDFGLPEIQPGDRLVLDFSVPPEVGQMVAGMIAGELQVWRLGTEDDPTGAAVVVELHRPMVDNSEAGAAR